MFNSLTSSLSAEGKAVSEPDWAEQGRCAAEMHCRVNSMVARAVCKEKLILGSVVDEVGYS